MTTHFRFLPVAIVAVLLFVTSAVIAPSAKAQASDPANDFLATYLGPQNGDLDVLSTGAVFNGSSFLFTATLNGAVGTTVGGFYVWGVDRGSGTAGFASLGLNNVLFDQVLVVRPNGTNAALATGTTGGNTLAPGSISFAGNSLSVLVPAAFLPNNGKTFSQYTINLWPRASFLPNGTTPLAGNAAISDFAPNNSNVLVTTAPEPGSLALAALGGIGLLGTVIRRRKN